MYLLLRNNKQTGPFSMEELKSMGLKAYDLVWLEGKSAAWRYPSEIEELKAFAPVVEEQPFDRFYRRPATAAANSNNDNTVTGTAPTPVTVESAKTPGKRIIYVTMPAARNTSPNTSSNTSSTTYSNTSSNTLNAAAQREPLRETIQPSRETIQAPRETTIAVTREPAPRVIEDYAAPLTEDQAVIEEFFPRRKRSPRVMRLLIIGICILALLAAGIIIGLNLNKDTLGFPAKVVARIPSAGPSTPDQTIVHRTAQALPAPAATTPAMTTGQSKSTDSVPAIVEQSNTASPVVNKPTVRIPAIKTPKERPANPTTRTMTRASGLTRTKDSAAGGSIINAVHRADIAEPHHDNTEIANKETVKAALASQVSVGANGYSVGTFGGINDLQLTVTNRSAYPLELVIVEVQYIQANKKVFKKENLYFRDIGAGAALMQEAPKSSRGVKIQYKITSITSKEGLSYSGI